MAPGGGGASQLHAINSSIMDLGLENFGAKESWFNGQTFLQCVFVLTLVIVHK